jgi:hypothetical protein
MELFVLISGIGTLALLAVHLLDYFAESRRRTLVQAQLPTPNEAVPADVAHQPTETAAHYDQAA